MIDELITRVWSSAYRLARDQGDEHSMEQLKQFRRHPQPVLLDEQAALLVRIKDIALRLRERAAEDAAAGH